MKGLCVYLRSVFSNPRGILLDAFFFFFPISLAYLRLSKHKVYSGAPRWEKCLQGISLARVRGFTCTGGETVQAKVNRATITLPVGTQGCWREALVHGNIRQSL